MKETISAEGLSAFDVGRSIPEVQAVFVLFKDDRILHVWAVVTAYDRNVYRKIYAKEKEIIRQFENIDFEFNIAPSHGRDPRTMISDPGAQLAFLRK